MSQDGDEPDPGDDKVKRKRCTAKEIKDDMNRIYEYWEYFGKHRLECEKRRKDPKDRVCVCVCAASKRQQQQQQQQQQLEQQQQNSRKMNP